MGRHWIGHRLYLSHLGLRRGYFAMMRDFALSGRLQGPSGSSVVTRPKTTPSPP
jgi:hypothetical protein